jgi:hypothetical protein
MDDATRDDFMQQCERKQRLSARATEIIAEKIHAAINGVQEII